MLDRRVVINFMDHIFLVRKACTQNFRPHVPSLHVEKLVVGGWWDLKVDFSDKLYTQAYQLV